MFQDFEATVTVDELIVPDAPPGARVHVAVRELADDWARCLGAGTLRGPSLSDEATRRESIYVDDAP